MHLRRTNTNPKTAGLPVYVRSLAPYTAQARYYEADITEQPVGFTFSSGEMNKVCNFTLVRLMEAYAGVHTKYPL